VYNGEVWTALTRYNPIVLVPGESWIHLNRRSQSDVGLFLDSLPEYSLGLDDSQSINLSSPFGHFCGTETECNAKEQNSFRRGTVFRAGLREGIGTRFQSNARYQDERSGKEVKEGRQDVFAPFVGGARGDPKFSGPYSLSLSRRMVNAK
jgi:hypothetical protein